MTAFTELLEAEIPKLRRYARALTRDAVRADDLVQNALVRALAKQHLWQPGTDLRAWLFTILHHQNVNDVRRSLREGDRLPVDHVAATLATVSDPTTALQICDLERAIATLPQEQRQVLLLVGLEGMRYEEVAAILDIPIGTVLSRLSRGRETLRRLMDVRGRADVNRGSPSCKAPYPIASEGAAVSAFSRLGRDPRREMRQKLPRDGRSGAPLSPVIGFLGDGGARLAKVTTARGVAGNTAGARLPAADHRISRRRVGGGDDNRIFLGRQHLGHRIAKVAATDAMRAESHQSPPRQTDGSACPPRLDGARARRPSARSSGCGNGPELDLAELDTGRLDGEARGHNPGERIIRPPQTAWAAEIANTDQAHTLAGATSDDTGGIDFGPNARIELQETQLRWLPPVSSRLRRRHSRKVSSN